MLSTKKITIEDFNKRIEALSNLKDNEIEEGSKSLNKEYLTIFQRYYNYIYEMNKDFEILYLYPDAEGNLLCELELDNFGIDLKINLDEELKAEYELYKIEKDKTNNKKVTDIIYIEKIILDLHVESEWIKLKELINKAKQKDFEINNESNINKGLKIDKNIIEKQKRLKAKGLKINNNKVIYIIEEKQKEINNNIKKLKKKKKNISKISKKNNRKK